MNPSVDAVGPGYFSTMGQALLKGREFSVKDANGAPKVAIINESMAAFFFGTTNPIGRHIGWGRDEAPNIEIVGVVKDAKASTLRQPIGRFVYTPYMQEDEIGQMTFDARARRDASHVAQSVRAVAQRVDPNLPIFDMKTMTQTMDDSLFIQRMVAAFAVGERPLWRDVVLGRTAHARDRHPHGARRRACVGAVARAARRDNDGDRRRRDRAADCVRAQPRRAVSVVRALGARSDRARRVGRRPGAGR